MPRVVRVLLVALVVLLSGCTFPWEDEVEEDPAALGPPEAVNYQYEHDFLGNGRSLAFRINTSTGTVDLKLELRQDPDIAACKPDRTPARILIKKPDDVLVAELVAKNAVGGEGAREDGSGECGAVLEQTVTRTRGVWRIEFLGSGNFTAHASIRGDAAPASG